MTGDLFTSHKRTVSNFVGQTAISSIRATLEYPLSKDLEKCVYECASTSVEVLKRFDVVCGQTVGTRKQRVKEVFFSCLGFTDILTPRNIDDSSDLIRKSKQKKEL